jgi:hypothetical protein
MEAASRRTQAISAIGNFVVVAPHWRFLSF